MILLTEDNDCRCMLRNCSNVLHHMLFRLLFLGTPLGARHTVLILAWDSHCLGMESVSLSSSFGCMHVIKSYLLLMTPILFSYAGWKSTVLDTVIHTWIAGQQHLKFFFNWPCPIHIWFARTPYGLPYAYGASQKPIRVWDIPYAYGPSHMRMGRNIAYGIWWSA